MLIKTSNFHKLVIMPTLFETLLNVYVWVCVGSRQVSGIQYLNQMSTYRLACKNREFRWVKVTFFRWRKKLPKWLIKFNTYSFHVLPLRFSLFHNTFVCSIKVKRLRVLLNLRNVFSKEIPKIFTLNFFNLLKIFSRKFIPWIQFLSCLR